MKKYLIKRVLQIFLTLWIFMTVVYILLWAQPGDITQLYIQDPKIPPEAREALKVRLGLDKPLYEQYFQYLANFAQLNLGLSFSNYPTPVWNIIMERLPRTVVLFLIATIVYYLVGFRLGKVIAWRRGGVLDYTATFSGVILWTVYTPWFALLLIWIFGVWLHLLPLGQFLNPLLWRAYKISPNDVFSSIILVSCGIFLVLLTIYLIGRKLRLPQLARVGLNVLSVAVIALGAWWAFTQTTEGPLVADILQHMVLPATTLALIGFGGAMLLTRDSMVDVIKEDYVLAARAKGLPEKVVRNNHAARNALLPVVTSFILAIAFTVDGGIITETVFSWKGIGLTLYESVVEQDYPLAVGTFVFTGIFALIAHLVADIAYAYLDPRIRYH